MLAVNAAGDWAGSVSGGCLEEDLLRRAVDGELEDRRSQRMDYGISDDDQERFRLPCGGTMEILVEALDPARDLAHLQDVQARLQRRQRVTRLIDDQGMRVQDSARLSAGIMLDAEKVYHTLGPVSRMLLVGAGEVARLVARFAQTVDFEVSLCEPRDTFISGWDEPGVEILRELPDDLIRERFNDPHTAVLALAHDPRVDDMALLEALNTSAFYVGAMGSPRTSAQRRQRLHELGLDDAAIARLHAPIGFRIGSKTPGEIALAIMAEVVAERYRLLKRL